MGTDLVGAQVRSYEMKLRRRMWLTCYVRSLCSLNKRKGNVVAWEDVQNVKRVCTDWTRCVSESECDSERENEYSTQQPNKQQITATRQRKKKRMTMTKEEKALAVAANIRGRMGFQQELLFRGKGKDSHQCFH